MNGKNVKDLIKKGEITNYNDGQKWIDTTVKIYEVSKKNEVTYQVTYQHLKNKEEIKGEYKTYEAAYVFFKDFLFS